MATLIQVTEDGPLTTYYYAENVVMVENAQTGDVTARKLPDPMALIREQQLVAYRVTGTPGGTGNLVPRSDYDPFADAPRHTAEVAVDD